jgi:CRP-like cAMP-binding protein/DNA-binding response OmpR family regulator
MYQPKSSLILSGQTILAVDDEPLVRLESILRRAGADVLPANNMVEALKAADDPSLRAAVLDVRLGASDIDPVCEKLSTRRIPFIFATGNGQRILDRWPHAIAVSKPFSADRIIASVTGALVGTPPLLLNENHLRILSEIEEAERRAFRQEQLIARLRTLNREATGAEELLRLMREGIANMREAARIVAIPTKRYSASSIRQANPHPLRQNRLLASLSDRDLAMLKPKLRPVTLKFRQHLQQTNRRIDTVYFIERGIASKVTWTGGGGLQTETALIGREGMTGVSLLYGVERSPWDIFIQAEGEGQAIGASDLRDALDKSVPLHHALLRYAFVLTVQIAHTAVVNAHGRLEERLARWLLMTQDRIEKSELLITHEFMALMLGVRRAGVTRALQDFEDRGLIRHARGSVTIVDRDGLIETANGFYGAPEAEAERVFTVRYKNWSF